MIQLYGCFTGYWSHATVSRGMTFGLHVNRVPLQIKDINRYGIYEGLAEPIEQGGYGINVPAGWQSSAPVGLYIGGYPHQTAPWLDNHAYKAALLITESEVIPPVWLYYARQLDLIVVPSTWVKTAFVGAGLDPGRIMVVPHGLHPEYGLAYRYRVKDNYRFLHVAGTADYLDRKGTPQLVRAFTEVFGPGGRYAGQGRLFLRVPPCPHAFALQKEAPEGLVEILPSETALPPHKMPAFLLSGWAALVQPSRAEAFGLLPLEAAAVGVPVIATLCSGHSEHKMADVVIEHGPSSPLRTNWVPNGRAPSVSVAAIANALEAFMADRPQAFADGVYSRWNWPDLCRPLAARLRTEHRRRRRASTLENKLGIG